MTKNVFLIDINKCNGCHNCQVACKDEHCDQDWLPYAAAQPDTGQFWCKVEETVHGTVPKVNITYLPLIGAQDDAIRDFAPEVCMEREDGLVVIDPAKAKGRKDIAEKFEGVFFNEELQVPQGCTGCAHLLDDGWDVPRCVDACATKALRFGDEASFGEELSAAEKLTEGSHVYYLNLPKRWVAGQVYDEAKDEVVIGAKVTMQAADGSSKPMVVESDDFGDFWFRQVEATKYNLWFEADGYVTRQLSADATEADANIGTVGIYTLK